MNIRINCELPCCWSLFPVSPCVSRIICWIWIDCFPDYLASILVLFTNEEYVDILYCYGYRDGNTATARRECPLWFPDRHEVDANLLSAVNGQIRETVKVQR